MTALRLLTVPYDLGTERVGMGLAADRFLEAGVVARAGRLGLDVTLEETARGDSCGHQVGDAFAVLRAHAGAVAHARADGSFPLSLGGNCATALAAVAGAGDGTRTGVVWFDAHGDANTPDTSGSGFLDGMSLATLVGWCWRTLARSVPGFAPVREEDVVLAACRDVDPDEEQLLGRSGVTVVPAARMLTTAALRTEYLPAVESLVARVDEVHVHVDLDAIDLADGRANRFAADGGPDLDALTAALDTLAGTGRVASASLASYDPVGDPDQRALRSALRLVDSLMGAAVR